MPTSLNLWTITQKCKILAASSLKFVQMMCSVLMLKKVSVILLTTYVSLSCTSQFILLDFISIPAKQFKLFLSLLGCTKDEHCTADPNKKYCDTTDNVCVSIKGELGLHFADRLRLLD